MRNLHQITPDRPNRLMDALFREQSVRPLFMEGQRDPLLQEYQRRWVDPWLRDGGWPEAGRREADRLMTELTRAAGEMRYMPHTHERHGIRISREELSLLRQYAQNWYYGQPEGAALTFMGVPLIVSG